MNPMLQYVEGIEVIKAFGHSGAAYEKFSKAIEDYRKFIVKWLSSTWVPFKLAFAFFQSTLLGTLPVSLFLASTGEMHPAQSVLCVMLSMSMVTSLAKLEVFGNSIKEVLHGIDLKLPASIAPENEHLIQGALAELTKGKTVITIAHRLATVENADQILVVEDGRIVQRGPHEELAEEEGLYRRFVEVRKKAEGWTLDKSRTQTFSDLDNLCDEISNKSKVYCVF